MYGACRCAFRKGRTWQLVYKVDNTPILYLSLVPRTLLRRAGVEPGRPRSTRALYHWATISCILL